MAYGQITWLHISDLHHGQRGEDGRWPRRREVALDDMREWSERLGPPQIVFFTGDLTYSGKKEEFERVDVTLNEIRAAVGGDPVVIPVPGNHDLVRPAKTDAPARGLRDYLDDAELRTSITTRTNQVNLTFLRDRFAAYREWWKQSIEPEWKRRDLGLHEGLFPGDFRLSIEHEGLRLGVLGLNSAFLQLLGGDYHGKLAVEPEQAGNDMPRWATQHHAAVLLMHHPLDWQAPAWQEQFNREIYASRRFIACLVGHMHRPIDAEIRTNGQIRRWLQSASLFGLEHYGDASKERRQCGYQWGRLERCSATHGKLTRWRRELVETHGGDLRFGPPGGEEESESFEVELRDLESSRSRSSVVSVQIPWKEVASELYEQQFQQAREAFHDSRFAEALAIYARIRDDVEKRDHVAQDRELGRIAARAKLGAAASLLNLQDIEGAAEQAARVDASLLEPAGRISLAYALAQVKETERAAEVLAGVEGVSAEQVTAISQLIDAARGDLPDNMEELSADPLVRLRVSGVLIERGQHDRAARLALDILDREDATPLERAAALDTLLTAMEWSTNDMPAGCAKVNDRESIAGILQQHLDPLKSFPLGDVLPSSSVAWLMARFQYLSRDDGRLELARSRLDDERLAQFFDPMAPPDDSVEMDLVRVPGHPWHERFKEAVRLAQAGKSDQARSEIAALTTRFPGHLPLEWLAANLCEAAGDMDQALEHAERAFDAFPGHGQALLLARLHYAQGQRAVIWTRLRRFLVDSPAILARRLLAVAVPQEDDTQAPALWRHVIAHEDAMPSDHISLASSLRISDQTSEAIQVAWDAFENDHDGTLTTDELGRCALLQLELPEDSGRDRVITIARALGQRVETHKDREAARWYLMLRDRARELPLPPSQRLEQLGVVERVSHERVVQLREERATHVQVHLTAYGGGLATFESCARGLRRPEALLFQQLLARDVPFRTALELDVEVTEIANRHILVGMFELLLLDELGVLGAFDRALGTRGCMVVFDDVEQSFVNAQSLLRLRERPDELGRLRALRHTLEHHARVVYDTRREDEPTEEAGWCEHRKAALVRAHVADGELSLRILVDELHTKGLLSASEQARIHALLPPSPPAGEAPWPATIALDASALHVAAQADILDSLIAAFSNPLLITPHARDWLESQIRRMEWRSKARERATRLHRTWIDMKRRGRARSIPAPGLDLPPLRDNGDPASQGWIHEAARWPLALESNRDLWLLRADYLSAEIFVQAVPPAILGSLAWTQERYSQVAERVRAQRERVLSFAALMRTLTSERKICKRLLDLGFVNAYGVEDLLELAAGYQGLAAAAPARTLDRIEETARNQDVEGRQVAHRRIARLYAQTIWQAWRTSPLAENVTTALLDRALALQGPAAPSTLSSLWMFLLALAVQNPAASFEEADGDQTLTTESPAGRMWRFIAGWLGRDSLRCSTFDLASVDFLVELDETLTDDIGLHIGPLFLAGDRRRWTDPAPTMPPPGSLLDAMAILSAFWRVRPLSWLDAEPSTEMRTARTVSVEDLLTAAAASLEHEDRQIIDNGLWWMILIDIEGQLGGAVVPPAAAFLRASPDTRARMAAWLITQQGPDDGRLVELLARIAQDPDDMPALREYARLFAVAPWRRFRAMPQSLLHWRASHQSTLPASIEELRLLLSESDPLPEDIPLAEAFLERVRSGSWKDRPDALGLLLQSNELLGAPELALMGRMPPPHQDSAPVDAEAQMRDAVAAESENAMERLAEPAAHPAARIAGDVWLMGMAALLDEQIRQRAAQCVRQALEAALAPPPEHSLAAFEPRMLQIAAYTVQRLHDVPEALRDRLWLTWRLYQWMVRQVRSLPEGQPELMQALVASHTGLAPRPEADLLDPSRFGHGRFNHRLIAILHALASLQPPLLLLLWTSELEELVQKLATEHEISPEEREVASLPSPCLAWGDLPRTVPELASRVLDGLRIELAEALGIEADSAT